MKKLLLFFPLLLLFFSLSSSCRFAPSAQQGDTVAAKEFEPVDETIMQQQDETKKADAPDSSDIFIIGEGSTRDLLQLVSYPSRRDTMLFGKKRPLKVTGSADFGRIVRIGFVLGKDSTRLVKTVEEIRTGELDTVL